MKKHYDCADNNKIAARIKKKASEFELKTVEDIVKRGNLTGEVNDKLTDYYTNFKEDRVAYKLMILQAILSFVHKYYNNKKVADLETVELCNQLVVTTYFRAALEDFPNPTREDLLNAEMAVVLIINLYEDARKKKF